jgi:glucose/arabinose dehydrogenase
MPIRPFLLALASVAVLALAGCSDDGGDGDLAGEQQLEAPVETDADADGSTTSAGDDTVPEVPPLRLTEVGQVLLPTAMAADPNTGDLYVTAQEGAVHRLDPETGETAEVIDISSDVTAGGERGLLGLTFDPDGEHLYLSYTNAESDTRIDEYEWVDGAVVEGSRREVLAQDQPFSNHNGGDIHFGPDGYLYVGLGDGGAGGDPSGTGQRNDDLLGSILRIDPLGTAGGEGYAIPDDNPFVDGGGSPEIWVYGVRNPWRFTFDRDTGDLWIGDVGQESIEEITYLPAEGDEPAGRGANLGWAEMEGTAVFGDAEPDGHVPPVHEYDSNDGNCSVTGGYVYRGEAIEGLDGAYLYGDFCAGELLSLRVDDEGALVDQRSLEVSLGSNTLSSFGEDLDGELYVLSLGEGKVYKLEV